MGSRPTEVHLQGHVQRRDAPPLGRRPHGPQNAAEAREAREGARRGAREAEPGLRGGRLNWWVRLVVFAAVACGRAIVVGAAKQVFSPPSKCRIGLFGWITDEPKDTQTADAAFRVCLASVFTGR